MFYKVFPDVVRFMVLLEVLLEVLLSPLRNIFDHRYTFLRNFFSFFLFWKPECEPLSTDSNLRRAAGC